MKIFLDMDGVLVNFVAGACARHGRPDPYLDPANYGNFDMAAIWGMPNGEFWRKLDGADFWANLDWMPDGREILEMVELRFGAKNVCLLTAPCLDPQCIPGKLAWVDKHLPQYRSRFIPTAAKGFLAHKNAVLFDDRDSNIAEFRLDGGAAFLIPRPWNAGHHIVKDNWLQTMSLLVSSPAFG